ncbi:MAG: FKBP-type peptidyl-prolyl cis-trans isomerase [Gemmatimonadaceae bacterium]|nr:FKBP-type peptidyl-prolyl cis-trans isomerase [Gemmatimonadaceae bacterium]
MGKASGNAQHRHHPRIRMRLRPHHAVRAFIAVVMGISVIATAGHAQVTVATRDSQLLASPISAMLPVDVARLRALGPGLLADDLVAGTGAEATRGLIARMRAEVWLTDGTRVRAGTCQSLQFKIGSGILISGADVGVRGMRVGGTRVLVVGAERAYGSRGVPGDVPPHATLIMRFQLLAVSEGSLPNPDECVRS